LLDHQNTYVGVGKSKLFAALFIVFERKIILTVQQNYFQICIYYIL